MGFVVYYGTYLPEVDSGAHGVATSRLYPATLSPINRDGHRILYPSYIVRFPAPPDTGEGDTVVMHNS